ncbi:MAG: helix-turn-helix transcriptional regulator [Treponema sp.]|jgi:putative molybdopterin biosynthesis protein|nr:helix-turn-helix transcriptional regulator [Treponema sp.]
MTSTLLTAQDVAEQLQIKKYTVYELIKRGELPSSKVGKQVRVSQEDINRYLRSRRTGFDSPVFREPKEQRGAEGGRLPEVPPTGLIISGQDMCLDLLVSCISRTGNTALRSYMGCYNGLYALYHGKVNMVSVHLWDSETGVYNYPFIRRLLPGLPVGVLRLAGRIQGFYVKKGNPLEIRDWKDLARPDITMINRERGCGTRILLDQKIRQLGIKAQDIRGYTRESSSHMAAASIVAKGGADLGCGCERTAGTVSALDFIPLQLEWYDFVFRLSDRHTEAVESILAYVIRGDFKQDMEMLGGYDTSETGRYEEL